MCDSVSGGLALRAEVDRVDRRLVLTETSALKVSVQDADIHNDSDKTALTLELSRPVTPAGRIEIDVPPGARVEGFVQRYAGFSSQVVIAEIPLLPKGPYRAHINRTNAEMVDLTGTPLPHLEFVFEVR